MPDTIDTTKQKLSVAVDGTTVKIVNDVLVSQKLTPLDGGVVTISDDNKISVDILATKAVWYGITYKEDKDWKKKQEIY